MSFKFFLGINPEDDVIAPTTLTKFRRTRLQDLDIMDLLLKNSVQIALEHKLIEGKAIIVDSTHTLSRSNPIRPMEMLRKQSAMLRKSVYQVDPTYIGNMPEKYTGTDLAKEMEYTSELIEILSADEKLMLHKNIAEGIDLLNELLEDIKDYYTLSVDRDARIGHKTANSEFFGYKTHIAMSPERIVVAATVTSGEKHDGPELPALIEKSKEMLPNSTL